MDQNQKKYTMLKKMIAPIVIAIITIIYFVFFIKMILLSSISMVEIVIEGIIALALVGCMIYVTYERIQEIRSGDEDDLSKY